LRATPRLTASQTAVAALLGLYFVVQIVMPLRHFAFAGNAEWTKAGNFHAWRMLLYNFSGDTAFFLTSDDPAAICEVDHTAYLYPAQVVYLIHPDAMVQFARYVASEYEKRGGTGFEVHVWTNYAFNGRENRGLVDPEVDLLSVDRPLGRESWVIDLDDAVPLERPQAERCPDPAPIERLRQLEDLTRPE
jgi:hypothetical protein